jgi:hypothetical protein
MITGAEQPATLKLHGSLIITVILARKYYLPFKNPNPFPLTCIIFYKLHNLTIFLAYHSNSVVMIHTNSKSWVTVHCLNDLGSLVIYNPVRIDLRVSFRVQNNSLVLTDKHTQTGIIITYQHQDKSMA